MRVSYEAAELGQAQIEHQDELEKAHRSRSFMSVPGPGDDWISVLGIYVTAFPALLASITGNLRGFICFSSFSFYLWGRGTVS